jgi:predicted transcriptional regulator YdeE
MTTDAYNTQSDTTNDSAEFEELHLVGLALGKKTSNENGLSAIDCGALWTAFDEGDYFEKITEKISEEILAVYYQYEGDYTQPFTYFIGCKVSPGFTLPDGLTALTIPASKYQRIAAKGKLPDCLVETWQKIWASTIPRSYRFDFEVYDERSQDWENAEVDVFLSLRD